MLPVVTSLNERSIQIAKTQINTLKIGIATLRSINYADELLNDANIQSMFLLVDVKSKIPMGTYASWCNEKERLKKLGKTPNIKQLADFYEAIVETNNDAIYIRSRLEDLTIKSTPTRGARTKILLANSTDKNRPSSDRAKYDPDRRRDGASKSRSKGKRSSNETPKGKPETSGTPKSY